MATATTQFYKSVLLIGSTPIPAYPGATLRCDKNWAIPPIIGNYWQWNYGIGFRQPVVDINLVVRDKAGEALSASFLNMFTTRSADAAHDTTAITGGIQYWDGRTGFTMNGAKADSFSISCAKGEDIQMSVRFVGTTITALGSAPVVSAWDNTQILRFKGVNLGSAMTDKIWRFGLSFSNNHSPDMSLNGSEFPAAQNAGMMTVGFNCRAQAADAAAIEALDASGPFAQTVVITGSTKTCTFTLNGLLANNPSDRVITVPRNMRDYVWSCLGGDGQTTAPLTISSTF
jgi:hypothetical protein